MIRSIVLASGVLVMGTTAAFAQTDLESEPATASPPEQALITEQKERQLLSTELIGTEVASSQGDEIGRLESLLFDEDQKIVGGVVAVGGFLGIGAKSVALSWDAFDVRKGEDVILLDLTKEQLEAAPGFKDLAQIEAEEEAERARQQMQEQPAQPQESVPPVQPYQPQ